MSARLGNGQDAIEVAAALRPDVILMDIRMPTVDGITATRQLAGPGLLGAGADLTTFEDDEYVFGALKAGASGFLLNAAAPRT